MAVPDWADIVMRGIAVLGGILGTAGGLLTWLGRNIFVTKIDLDGHLAGIGSRIGALEGEMRHLPTSADIARVADRIGTVEGSVREISAQIGGVGDQVARVDKTLGMLVEFHIKEAAK